MSLTRLPHPEPRDLAERIASHSDEILQGLSGAEHVRRFRRSVLQDAVRRLRGEPGEGPRWQAGLEPAAVAAELHLMARQTIAWLETSTEGRGGGFEGVRAAFEDAEVELLERYSLSGRASEIQSVRQLSDFLELLAHDMRNPLSAMSNALKLLEFEQCVSERGIRALKLMNLQIQRVTRMADTIQDFAGVQKGSLQLHVERFDARELLQEIVRTGRDMAEVSRHRFESSIPEAPVPVEADRARFEQILVNLLLNAMKYTMPAGLIRLEAEARGDRLHVSLRDSGLGLTQELRSKIFNPFVEVNSGSKKGQRINLSLIKVLVERHGGRIEVHSEGQGKGTEFRLDLPLARQAVESRRDPEGHPGTESLRVLLTDDDADAVELFTLLLGEKGYEVRSATDGASALEACAHFKPDVVLLDISLPDMSGFELARRLRGIPGCGDAVFVALSGHSREFLQEHLRQSEFDHFLTKSFKFDNVAELLDGIAARRGR